MSKSKIEWTDETWNPVTGCSKVSQGCKNCYAEREWPRMVRLVPSYAGRAFTDVRTHEDRLDKPLHWKRPRRVFVNSMSDLFHDDVPCEFIDKVFAVMALAPQHVFQVLTKRPERMREYLTAGGLTERVIREAFRMDCEAGAWMNADHNIGGYKVMPLPNVHLGVSIEDQPTADARVIELIATPAAVRWVSVEPMLGPVNLNQILVNQDRGFHVSALHEQHDDCYYQSDAQLDWVVVGGESGPNARPMNPQWARDLRDQCATAGVPFLFKQWGEWGPTWTEAHSYLGFSAPIDPAGIESIAGTIVGTYPHEQLWPVVKNGKKANGRLLDGELHDGYPKEQP